MQSEIKIVPQPKKIVFENEFTEFRRFELADDRLFAPITLEKSKRHVGRYGMPIGVCVKEDANGDTGGYKLRILKNTVRIDCSGKRGLHYAMLTLMQIADAYDGVLPCVTVEDAPDFEVRGMMYDISRNRVPKLATLKHIVDILSDLKFNMFQLYVEGRSYFYESRHDLYGDPDDFLTPSDVAELKDYCAERFVELVPCANSLGHMIYWLNRPEYAHLAYSPDGFEWWEDGLHAPPGTLDPENPDGKKFLYTLFDDLLKPYGADARAFNIGGDEPFDMLFGKRALDDGGETYFSHICDVCENVRARGLTPLMWGDVAHKYPDKLDRLGDVVFLEWRYEAGEFDDAACEVYETRGKKFYVCPSSSLCSFTGKTENMLANMREAAHYGKKHGAAGFMNTEWGDGGSSQSLVSSVYCMGVAGCYAWNADEFDVDAINGWLNRNVYGHGIAALVADLGRYVDCQQQKVNGLPYLFSALYIRQTDGINRDRNNFSDPCGFFWRDELLTKKECDDTGEFLAELRRCFDGMRKNTRNVYVREVAYCLDVLDWALAHMRLCIDLKNLRDTPQQIRDVLALGEKCVGERQKLWFIRNKKSDFALSIYRYKALLKKYRRLLADSLASE